ncbi:MAG: nucleotidyltransferase domain-containing protein [Gaiellaceae bacterium]
MPLVVNDWPDLPAAAQLRQWPRIVSLAERVEATPHLAALVLLGSFARGEADPLSDVDFIVLVEPGRFEEAWTARHDLHPDDVTCWDYARPDEREVAAHRWLTSDLVLFDGLLSTASGSRIADPLVVLVGDASLVEEMSRFDPTSGGGQEIELHQVEKLYGQLKLAARAARVE